MSPILLPPSPKPKDKRHRCRPKGSRPVAVLPTIPEGDASSSHPPQEAKQVRWAANLCTVREYPLDLAPGALLKRVPPRDQTAYRIYVGRERAAAERRMATYPVLPTQEEDRGEWNERVPQGARQGTWPARTFEEILQGSEHGQREVGGWEGEKDMLRYRGTEFTGNPFGAVQSIEGGVRPGQQVSFATTEDELYSGGRQHRGGGGGGWGRRLLNRLVMPLSCSPFQRGGDAEKRRRRVLTKKPRRSGETDTMSVTPGEDLTGTSAPVRSFRGREDNARYTAPRVSDYEAPPTILTEATGLVSCPCCHARHQPLRRPLPLREGKTDRSTGATTSSWDTSTNASQAVDSDRRYAPEWVQRGAGPASNSTIPGSSYARPIALSDSNSSESESEYEFVDLARVSAKNSREPPREGDFEPEPEYGFVTFSRVSTRDPPVPQTPGLRRGGPNKPNLRTTVPHTACQANLPSQPSSSTAPLPSHHEVSPSPPPNRPQPPQHLQSLPSNRQRHPPRSARPFTQSPKPTTTLRRSPTPLPRRRTHRKPQPSTPNYHPSPRSFRCPSSPLSSSDTSSSQSSPNPQLRRGSGSLRRTFAGRVGKLIARNTVPVTCLAVIGALAYQAVWQGQGVAGSTYRLRTEERLWSVGC